MYNSFLKRFLANIDGEKDIFVQNCGTLFSVIKKMKPTLTKMTRKVASIFYNYRIIYFKDLFTDLY